MRPVIHSVVLNGKLILLVDAAKRHGLPVRLVRERLRDGWTDMQAFGLDLRPPPPSKVDAVIERNQMDAEARRLDDDARFQDAMIAAGYQQYVHTEPGTQFPRMLAPAVRVRLRSYSWDMM